MPRGPPQWWTSSRIPIKTKPITTMMIYPPKPTSGWIWKDLVPTMIRQIMKFQFNICVYLVGSKHANLLMNIFASQFVFNWQATLTATTSEGPIPPIMILLVNMVILVNMASVRSDISSREPKNLFLYSLKRILAGQICGQVSAWNALPNNVEHKVEAIMEPFRSPAGDRTWVL